MLQPGCIRRPAFHTFRLHGHSPSNEQPPSSFRVAFVTALIGAPSRLETGTRSCWPNPIATALTEVPL